jgi:hypothetical protein
MAENKPITDTVISADEILNKIYVDTHYRKKGKNEQNKLFISENLNNLDTFISGLLSENNSIGNNEWQSLELSKTDRENVSIITLRILPQDKRRYIKNLQSLEQCYLQGYSLKANDILIDMVLHGQELLRRKYLAKLCDPDKKISIGDTFKLIIETGASAIQILGKIPRSPYRSFSKFNSTQKPNISTTGIEILSSGAFPDWTDQVNKGIKNKGLVNSVGFENVIEAAMDTPRSRAISRAIKQKKISPYLLPAYLRTMLDLELMRLGQATTPGTFKMLLNSSYYGARIVNHSTNVSEQVQIIYGEENWKPAYRITADIPVMEQAQNAACYLITEFYRFKNLSPVNRDHKRTARIQFDDTIDNDIVSSFFSELLLILDKGKKIKGKSFLRNKTLHLVAPVLKLNTFPASTKIIKEKINLIKRSGFNELLLISDYVKHYPGLLQYFSDAEETNRIIKYSKSQRVKLTDGRTVDMVATSNKTIEAAAGAMMSGQGCIKVGLLGLTYEQMYEFIKYVKDGLVSKTKRQGNQLLVFIGLVDEPIVSEKEVFTNAKIISQKFIELMGRRRHDILLLDTMHKGKNDKRLVSEKDTNPDDTKGGHVSFKEMKALAAKAHNVNCDLWVAGSYTEGQVYQASLEELKYRPGLICLGGAERSFGGIRLDPSDAYEPVNNTKEEKSLSFMLQMDSDIQFILSRDNKLARDSGHIEGELRRRKKTSTADSLKRMRNNYLKIRKDYFDKMHSTAVKLNIRRRNMDILILGSDKIISKLKGSEKNKLLSLKSKFENSRIKYVDKVTNYFCELYSEEWFSINDHN